MTQNKEQVKIGKLNSL